MFLPTSQHEMQSLKWERLDVILITGDTYIDSPFMGSVLIGKLLVNAGYRVGIIAQPDIHSDKDITRLGEPALFWGVTSGSVDSMIANYTATHKKRKSDDFTPGGKNNQRPDRAVIVYGNLIRRYFKQTVPIVLGGIEASLRRIAHYDYWSDRVRKSILLDAKADYLIYGMGEKAVLALASALKNGKATQKINGLAYIGNTIPNGYLQLPSFAAVIQDKQEFIRMFRLFYQNNDPITSKGLVQPYDQRYYIQNPPQPPLSQSELDAVHALGFERQVHPWYAKQGAVKALATIQFSIASHRGCYGECNFCAITVHQGRTVQWRSEQSIVAEAKQFLKHPDFKGIIPDVGGPTANMYGFECHKKQETGACKHQRCIHPDICTQLNLDHHHQIKLLKKLRSRPGIRKVFVASGLRYDLVLHDQRFGIPYLNELVRHHISGQLKIAPEHASSPVLKLMGKPDIDVLLEFKQRFDKLNRGRKQFLTYYFIAAHPGCTQTDMQQLRKFIGQKLKLKPEQVQIFIPAPSTWSGVMYYTEMDPVTMQPIFVEKQLKRKQLQKNQITDFKPQSKKRKPWDKRKIRN